ncbi:hypothetical protein F4808DRAFT_453809 [Astrocystis sublimbata]|nr:hypothetical protein F4808DRAFT_453809 [Astrocystis sublimbata]
MGSTCLGGQKATPEATAEAVYKNQAGQNGQNYQHRRDSQNSQLGRRAAATQTKSSLSLSLSYSSSNKTSGPMRTETARSSAPKRVPSATTANRLPAKTQPHATPISTTRNNNNNHNRNITGQKTAPASTACATTHAPRLSLVPPPQQPPPPPAPLSHPPHPPHPPSPNLSTASTSPLPTPPPLLPPLSSQLRVATTTTTNTTNTTKAAPTTALPPTTTITQRSRARPCPSPLSLTAASATGRRNPLLSRDQNVGPVLAPAVKDQNLNKMGHETSTNPPTANPNPNNTNTNANSRPPMPSLSATAARGLSRAPLTPKIASVSRHSHPQTPSLAATNSTTAAAAASAPTVRRSTQKRPVSTIATSTRSPYDDSATVSAAAAAFNPHIVHNVANVTPRSGTPNGTPSQDRFDPWDVRPPLAISSPSAHGDLPRRPVVTFSAVSPDRNPNTTMPSRQDSANARDSKFFHASEAKTSRPTSSSKMTSPRNSAFFYANSNGIKSKPSSPATMSPPLSPALSKTHDALSKFMYANGTPELRPTPPPLASPPNARTSGVMTRPASPSKLPLHSPSAAAPIPAARAQVSPPASVAPPAPALRRSGTATSRSSGHSRSSSWVKPDGVSEPLRPMASPTIGLFPPANLTSAQPPLTLASIIQAAEEFTELEEDGSPDEQSAVQSPTKSNESSADPVTELIANARRERKVQDLQIRNASLEAINRTLERQMRKQTAELRRFRRLSRSGHLSVASTTASSRVPSGAISELDVESLGLSDLSEEELSMSRWEDESFSDTESASSGVSPSVIAERDEKHRHRDEERLQLDLSKHQQILVDSQKINQSIKRCLDWSEELINEGKKALDYQVRVSDVKLGGRVLIPVEEEDDNNTRLPLSDNTVALGDKLVEADSEGSTSWGTEPQDRDSGIELARDGG